MLYTSCHSYTAVCRVLTEIDHELATYVYIITLGQALISLLYQYASSLYSYFWKTSSCLALLDKLYTHTGNTYQQCTVYYLT